MFCWCALILVLLLRLNGLVDARVRTTADAIIVEVDFNDEREARSVKTPSGTYLLTEENRCWTSDGHQGVCSSLRSCYPAYQLPELKSFQSLNRLSIRGTCQYNKADGSQAYGVCCPRLETYFSPSFLGNNFFGGGNSQLGGGNPQFRGGSIPWLQPVGFPWWGARSEGGLPSHPSFPSIPASLLPPVAPVDMPTTESWESSTTKPTTTESWDLLTTISTESGEHSTTELTTIESWETRTPSATTPSTTTQQSLESWTTKWTEKPEPSPTTTATTKHPDVTEATCGVGPYKAQSIAEQNQSTNGTTAVKNSWPFMVSLQKDQRHFCGGSLINSLYILTAAHCIPSFTSEDVKKLEVVLAMHHLKGDTSAVRKRVSRVVRHKGYNSQTLYNDIAIMKLDSPATFGPSISPVCLPPASSSHNHHYGKEATVIGWGSTRFGGTLQTALQQVTVKVLTNEECRNIYGDKKLEDLLVSMFCAGLRHKKFCGDSGGPMVMQRAPGSPWTQIGVDSWGFECDDPTFPGVYISVAYYIGWINTNAT